MEAERTQQYMEMLKSKHIQLNYFIIELLQSQLTPPQVLNAFNSKGVKIEAESLKPQNYEFHDRGIGYFFWQTGENIPQQKSLVINNGTIFWGLFENEEIKEGVKLKNNVTYQGEFRNFLKQGQGLEFTENSYYVGGFSHDQKNGNGMQFINKKVSNSKCDEEYKGNWRNGLKYGSFQVLINNQRHERQYYNDIKIDKKFDSSLVVLENGSTIHGYHIMQGHLNNLNQGKKISPSVLKAYCCMLGRQYWRLASISKKPCKKVKILTEIVETMVGQKFSQSAVEQFEVPKYSPDYLHTQSSEPLPIFEYFNFFMMPIQILNSHFALITVEIVKNRTNQTAEFEGIDFQIQIRYYDSMRYEIEKEVKDTVVKYLGWEAEKYLKHLKEPKQGKAYDCFMKALNQLKLVGPEQMRLPEQQNEIDCGVWVAIFAREILYDLLTGNGKQWHKKDIVKKTRTKMINQFKFECAKII